MTKTKNESNVRRKPKSEKGLATFVIEYKLTIPVEKQIKNYINELSKSFLNDEPIKLKKNVNKL